MARHKGPWFPAALLALAGTALLAGGKFPYIFFYLTLFVFLVPYIRLSRGLKRLTGDIRVSAEYGQVGQPLAVDYRVQNPPGGAFLFLEMVSLPGAALPGARDRVISLEGGDTAHYREEVRFSRRGIYDTGSFRVKTGDPFGIFTLEKSLAQGRTIKVYPHLKPFPGVTPPARQHFGDLPVKERQFENYSQVADLREWQEGDSVKRVHWKQTARQGRLVVKNYAHKGDAALNIFIDMGERSYRRDRGHLLEDLAVEAAASFVHENLKAGIFLQVFSQALPRGRLLGRHFRDYREIMDHLIALSPGEHGNFTAYVDSRSYYLTPRSSLYLLTPSLSLPGAAVYLNLKERGFSPALFYLALREPGPEERVILQRVKEAGVQVQILYASGGRQP